MDEGYIKYQAIWEQDAPIPIGQLNALQQWRQILYEKQLIGVYSNGIGYGNISQRSKDESLFWVSGSRTGSLKQLSEHHYSKVTKVEVDQNRLHCRGPIVASSESMSHAVIYEACPEVGGVIHVHHRDLWAQLLHQVPTTDARAAYGTPEMAYSILDLLDSTDLRQTKLFVMEGHPEGLFTFGSTLEEAGQILIKSYEALVII